MGLAFAAAEAAAGLVWPAPLDVLPSPAALCGSAAGLAGMHALAAGLLGRTGLVAAVLLWSLVWSFEGPRSAGAPMLWGWLAVGAVVLVGGGLAAACSRDTPPDQGVSTLLSTGVSTQAAPSRVLFWWALTVSTLGAAWTPAWRPRTQVTPPAASPPSEGLDVLLVTVDTVRADHDLLDPWRDRRGWQVVEAVSAAPWTLPALHSLFTGAPVHEHGGGLPAEGAWTRRRPGLRSLVLDFAEEGYETHAVVSNPHLSSDQGFADGFHHWRHFSMARGPLLLLHNLAGLRRRHTGWPEPWRWERDATLTRAARALLGAPAPRPRFVWVHLLSPHEYRRTAEAPVPGWSPGTQDPAALRAAYAANIQATQARLQALVSGREDWVIAITSDHGEALGEAGHWGHGHHLDSAELVVPLAVYAPDAPPTLTGDPAGRVSTADLLPALRAAARGQPLQLTQRTEVAVGGLRDEATFGLFQADGTTQLRERGDVLSGPSVPPDQEQRAQLESLGYTLP